MRYNADIHTDYLRGKGVEFYIYCIVKARSQEALPKIIKWRAIKSIPREIDADLSDEEREEIQTTMDRGEAWYGKVEGKGWEWGKTHGAADVEQIHELLHWVYRFNAHAAVGGAKLLYCEINNKAI